MTKTWTGWEDGRSPQLRYGIVSRDDSPWSRTRPGSFGFKDLGLAAVTDGLVGAVHLRSTPDYEPEWFTSDLHFELVFVVSGSSCMEGLDGSVRTLVAGDAMILPPRWPHRGSQPSPDFEAVVITSPAVYDVFAGREGAVPSPIHPRYTSETPVAYASCPDAPQFRCRDLGTNETSMGRIGARISRTTTGGAATDWRYRTASQWLLVIGGHTLLRYGEKEPRRLEAGDAVSMGAGPGTRHRIGPCSADYAALELFFPADFETTRTGLPGPLGDRT
jgi:quercetin dioxygenase-like cupin family protein